LLAAAGLAPLNESERAIIAAHLRLLDAWNPAINLTRITAPRDRAVRHLLDALVAVPLIEPLLPAHGAKIADLGSGGGFPGVPLAARLLTAHSDASLELIEATQKKAHFLQTVANASGFGARLRVQAARAEALGHAGGPRYNLVTARAVAPLADLVKLALPILVPGGHLMAWKRSGSEWDDELALARSEHPFATFDVRVVSAQHLPASLLVFCTR
jgi:16S rRNA (guanine527-N7)-methyltransferase